MIKISTDDTKYYRDIISYYLPSVLVYIYDSKIVNKINCNFINASVEKKN